MRTMVYLTGFWRLYINNIPMKLGNVFAIILAQGASLSFFKIFIRLTVRVSVSFTVNRHYTRRFYDIQSFSNGNVVFQQNWYFSLPVQIRLRFYNKEWFLRNPKLGLIRWIWFYQNWNIFNHLEPEILTFWPHLTKILNHCSPYW